MDTVIDFFTQERYNAITALIAILSFAISALSLVIVMKNYNIVSKKRLSISASVEKPFDEVEIKLINIGIRPILIDSYSVLYADVRENIKKGTEIFNQNIEERLDELEQINLITTDRLKSKICHFRTVFCYQSAYYVLFIVNLKTYPLLSEET